MKMKTIKTTLLIASMTALSLTGCRIDEAGMEPGTFEISDGYLAYNFTQRQETVFIPVTTNIPANEWECTSTDDSWCKLAGSYGNETGLMLAVTESEEPEVRRATATVRAGGREYSITVAQLGYGPAILVTNQNISSAGGTLQINVTANIEYTTSAPQFDADDEADWITQNTDAVTKAFAQTGYSYIVQANMLPFERSAVINFTAVDEQYSDVSASCTVTQSTSTVDPGSSAIPDDDQVFPTVATATPYSTYEFNGTDSSPYLYDGKYDTYFHSPWEAEPADPRFPVRCEFTFLGEQDINYMTIVHRGASATDAGHAYGRIGQVNIYYKNADNQDYIAIQDTPFDLGQRGGIQTIYFPETIEQPTAIKLEILDGSGDTVTYPDGIGCVAIAEVEFYKSSAEEVQAAILNVFTDLSCSELRTNVTRDDITALYQLSPYLAQEVAASLMEGTYDEAEKEFRIATYEAYSSNTLNTQLRTRLYTRMDNPTGIYVEPGDEIIVCVDKIPEGHSVSIATYGEASDGYGPNYGGTGNVETVDQEVTLTAGVNTFTSAATGMLYVMNTASSLSESSEAIKVHILTGCGEVEGYFDLEKHQTDARYQELLAGYDYKYFVAKGRKMIFNFHTSQLRTDAPTQIVSGLQAWDDIVNWQHELMGLDDLTWFNNHVMAVSTTNPGAYMDASNRRVNFATTALNRIISREQLTAAEDNTWGPAHELGHVNQLAIDWKGSSESSNNLFSNYAIYRFGVYGSRGDMLSELALSWVNKENWEQMGTATHQAEDTELHMRMNWQLWIYYHLCDVKPDFWPTLFRMLREDPLPNGYLGQSEDVGAAMMKFVEKACDAAEEDLTEFFETWGFFVPVDVTIDQYGSARCNITEAMVNETKARIAAKGYHKAAPIQYIEDRNTKDGVQYCDMGYYTTFQKRPTVSTGSLSYSISGRTYTVRGCENAVAVELRKPAASGEDLGELVYFSNFSTFTVPDAADITNTQVYAVQADGQRIRIN